MLFVVIERFRRGPAPVYERAVESGRMFPDGLDYVDSWIDEWMRRWDDRVEFEVVPVIASAEAAMRFRRPESGNADAP